MQIFNTLYFYLTIPFIYAGQLTHIFLQAVYFLVRLKINWKLSLQQMALAGVNSLPIVLLTTAFTGMVIALQTSNELARVGASKFVGALIAIPMARELAPALSGVMVAGRAGASIAAEIGTMKVTQQIDALRAMATSPVYYLVVPRFLALIIMVPILTIFADFIGVLGGYFIAVNFGGINPNDFYASATAFVTVKDIIYGLIKAAVFGAIITLVGCHQGFYTEGGAAGVGKATTSSVVLSMVFIFAANYFLSMIMFSGSSIR